MKVFLVLIKKINTLIITNILKLQIVAHDLSKKKPIDNLISIGTNLFFLANILLETLHFEMYLFIPKLLLIRC